MTPKKLPLKGKGTCEPKECRLLLLECMRLKVGRMTNVNTHILELVQPLCGISFIAPRMFNLLDKFGGKHDP